MSIDPKASDRRAFLRRAGQLGVAGIAAPWAINLASMGEAAAFTASDYKALVCVFLYGGNDYGNTVVPYDATNYATLKAWTASLALIDTGWGALLTALATRAGYWVSQRLTP
jgi:uncharacterized protein (DUF1501 family)